MSHVTAIGSCLNLKRTPVRSLVNKGPWIKYLFRDSPLYSWLQLKTILSLRASGGNTGSLFFGYDHRVPSLRASLQAVSEFVARNPLIASLALPLVYFSKKNSRSLFVWTLFAILESNAVMKAGYSKLSPANTGDSFTGKWTAFCWLMRSELNSVCFACKLTRWLGVAPLSNDGCGWLCDALKAGICFGTKDCMFGLSSLLIWSTSRSLNWSLISVFDIFAFDLILNLVTFVIILVITVN